MIRACAAFICTNTHIFASAHNTPCQHPLSIAMGRVENMTRERGSGFVPFRTDLADRWSVRQMRACSCLTGFQLCVDFSPLMEVGVVHMFMPLQCVRACVRACPIHILPTISTVQTVPDLKKEPHNQYLFLLCCLLCYYSAVTFGSSAYF